MPGPVAPESFASGDLAAPFAHTFNTGGEYAYRCTHHAPDTTSGMVGHVIVDAASANTSAAVSVGSGGSNFAPASVTIKPGSTVTWTLVSGVHNVTRP